MFYFFAYDSIAPLFRGRLSFTNGPTFGNVQVLENFADLFEVDLEIDDAGVMFDTLTLGLSLFKVIDANSNIGKLSIETTVIETSALINLLRLKGDIKDSV